MRSSAPEIRPATSPAPPKFPPKRRAPMTHPLQASRIHRYSRRKHALMSVLVFAKMVLTVVAMHLAETFMREPQLLVIGIFIGICIAFVAPAAVLKNLEE